MKRFCSILRALCLLCLVLTLLLLLPGVVRAYEGETFRVDIPAGFEDQSGLLNASEPPPQGTSRYLWKNGAASTLALSVRTNEHGNNFYNATEEDLEIYRDATLEEVRQAAADLERENGWTCSVELVSASMSECASSPSVQVDIRTVMTTPEGDSLHLYQRSVVVTSAAHIYTLAYTEVNAGELTEEALEILGSFAVTEELFTGPTEDEWANRRRILERLGVLLTDLLLAGIVVYMAVLAVHRGRRGKKEGK